jgi:hypothetical protein
VRCAIHKRWESLLFACRADGPTGSGPRGRRFESCTSTEHKPHRL